MADTSDAATGLGPASRTSGSVILLADQDEDYLSTDGPWDADDGILHG